MAYNKRVAFQTLARGGGIRFADELDAWRSILDSVEPYPNGKYIPPLRAPKRKEKPRDIGAFTWEYSGREIATSRITALDYDVGNIAGRIVFDGDEKKAAQQLGELLLLPDCQGCLLAASGSADAGFAAFLRQFARPLLRCGFTLEPVATGTRCKAIILRKGRRTLWLTDVQEMTGSASISPSAFVEEYAPRDPRTPTSPGRMREALLSFQRQLQSMFGVSLHATIGSAALRAASAFVGATKHVWRPSPLMVAMLRAAHGFRGGYAYAEVYDGPAWRLDINKAYTAALSTALPLRAALAPAERLSEDSEGVFLCRVEGPGRMPVYLAPFRGRSEQWDPEYWNGTRCIAVLASSEVPGMRALGYRVTYLGGFVYVRTWNLDGIARLIAAICRKHGRGSAHERTAKTIGNSVYGKLAERPQHEEVRYAIKRPASDWHPMVDQRGEEMPDLWTHSTTDYRPGQHIDIAATVTGRVRGWLYEGMATTIALGGTVVHADTDGFLATLDPAHYLVTDESQPGSWRTSDAPERAIVWGRKAYAYGDEVRAAGFSGLSSGDAVSIAAGGKVMTEYTQMPAPWKSGAGIVKLHRLARATA